MVARSVMGEERGSPRCVVVKILDNGTQREETASFRKTRNGIRSAVFGLTKGCFSSFCT